VKDPAQSARGLVLRVFAS